MHLLAQTQLDITSIIDTAILGVVGIITTYLGVKVRSNSGKIDDVHTLVNQNLTDANTRGDTAVARVAELEEEAKPH
jgi:hypothetical protein